LEQRTFLYKKPTGKPVGYFTILAAMAAVKPKEETEAS